MTLRQRYERELTRGLGYCTSCLYWDIDPAAPPCDTCRKGGPRVQTNWESCREAVALLDATDEG